MTDPRSVPESILDRAIRERREALDDLDRLRKAIDRVLPESRDPANDEDVTISGYDFWAIRNALRRMR